jgi:hypothetical protein
MKNPAVRKRTKLQREAQLIQIAELHIRNTPPHEIAAKFGLSQSQISLDLKEIYQRLAPTSVTVKGKLRAKLLAENELMKKSLWMAWDRSLEDKEVAVKEQITSEGASELEGDGGKKGGTKRKGPSERLKAGLRTEGQRGNASFMSELPEAPLPPGSLVIKTKATRICA